MDHQQMNIFVVDDEPVIAGTLATILRISGFVATPFTNPLDALRWARTLAPDLLITDVVMPEMSGIELAIKVRELSPGCRILLFSGQATTADLLAAAKAEAHHFELLSKPVYPKDLVSRIRGLVTEPAPLALANTISADSTLGAA